MAEYRVGDEVLAPWMNDGFLYPGVVVKRAGATAHVAYLDGDEADVPVEQLRVGAFGPGLKIQVDWKGGGKYYGGMIVGRIGQALQMDYDDGSHEWTSVGKCRLPITLAGMLAGRPAVCTYCGHPIDPGAGRCGTCGASPPPPR
jgi:hypothetical protein